jgi:cold shock CspA family protein
MRRLLAGLALLALASVSSAAAPTKTPTHPRSHGYSLAGVIVRVDVAAKTFAVQSATGAETTLVRTSATRVMGDHLKPGDRVSVRYMEKDGKKIATSVKVEPVFAAAVTPTAAPAGGR